MLNVLNLVELDDLGEPLGFWHVLAPGADLGDVALEFAEIDSAVCDAGEDVR